MGKCSEANPFSRSLDNNFFRFETEFLCLWPIILFWTVCIKWPDSLQFIEWVLIDCSNEHEKIIFNSFLTFQFHLMKAQFRVDSTLFIRIESNALSWEYQTTKTFHAPTVFYGIDASQTQNSIQYWTTMINCHIQMLIEHSGSNSGV